MDKKNIFIWFISIILVFFLYLISSTNLILKDDIKKVYKVSVILNDTSEEFYNSFKKGIDKAASEFNVDVDIISLYDLSKRHEQKEIIEKEIKEGSDAIILEPIFNDVLYIEKQNVPFVIIGDTFYKNISQKNYSLMEINYKEIFLDLLNNINIENKNLKEIYVLCSGLDNYSNRIKYEQIENFFNSKHIRINLLDDFKDQDVFVKEVEKLKNTDKSKLAFLCLDKISSNKFLKLVDITETFDDFKNIYVFLASNYSLNSLLDKERPKHIFIDEYKLAYLSLKSAIDMLEYNVIHNENIEYKYINKNELINEEVIRIAYPID